MIHLFLLVYILTQHGLTSLFYNFLSCLDTAKFSDKYRAGRVVVKHQVYQCFQSESNRIVVMALVDFIDRCQQMLKTSIGEYQMACRYLLLIHQCEI